MPTTRFMLLGILVSLALPFLLKSLGLERLRYPIAAVALAALIVLAAFRAYVWMTKKQS